MEDDDFMGMMDLWDEIENPDSTSQTIHVYDNHLPQQHIYLSNNFTSVEKRNFLEEGSVVNLPLISFENFILMPGQTMPLTVSHPFWVSLLRSLVHSNKPIAVANRKEQIPPQQPNTYKISKNVLLIGTTADITEYAEESFRNNVVSLKLKLEGRQKFKLLKITRIENSLAEGDVKILSEQRLENPNRTGFNLFSPSSSKLNSVLLSASTPFPKFIYSLYDEDYLMAKVSQQLKHWTMCKVNSTKPGSSVQEVQEVHTSVNEDEPGQASQVVRTVTTRVRLDEEEDDDDDSESDKSQNEAYFSPITPAEFSYWVLNNLPLPDYIRLNALSLNSTVQRLRFEKSILDQSLDIFCAKCKNSFCDQKDVFSMSYTGPQGKFVNYGGYVHEMFTVRHVNNINVENSKSTQFSWFPGYAWSIMFCGNCHYAIGWKFTSVNNLNVPNYFFGIRHDVVSTFDMKKNLLPII